MINKFTLFIATAFLGTAWIGVSPAASAVTTAAVASSAQGHPPSSSNRPAKSLYERLGGIFPISAVVDRFSDAIIANPKLNKNPALVEWNQEKADTRLPGLKVMRTVWLAALAGGPFEYNGLPLSRAHKELRLTEEEFDEVGAEIVRALEHFGVPEAEKQELVKAYMRSKSQVVSASIGPKAVAPSK